ncbi:MAG TPA: efflux RND transporter periplasmic adaptor subunit [Gemmatimonadaceae bacterium]
MPTTVRPDAAHCRRGRSRLVLALLLASVACRREKEQTIPVETAAVARRTIVSEATASGLVEPINVIEVKSKSSGQITEMTVETGSLVTKGQLLIQLDPRDVNQQLAQAEADLTAAQAKLAVSKAQKERNDKMFADKIITAQEYEASQLDYANSVAAEIRSRSAVDIAKQRVEEAVVSAPVAGTIIEKPVSLGQVIASATNSASGGTILLKMADLTKVRVRALFNETDIGAVIPGQPATVTVDAFPDRPFGGTVEKIEPSAVVQSSVTMFPVLVTLDNREGLLKPGMNGEVTVLVERREDVLSVPNDAVRQTREAASTAKLVGLDPDSVVAAVQEQMRAMGGGGMGLPNGNGNGNGNSANGNSGRGGRGGTGVESRGDVDVALIQSGAQGGRQGFQLPDVTDADCQRVRDAFAKAPMAQTTLQGLRTRVQGGEIDMQRSRAISDSIYKSIGLDGLVARACQARDRQGGTEGRTGRGGGTAGGANTPGAAVPVASGGENPAASGRRGGRRGASNAAALLAGMDVPVSQASPRRQTARPALVYVASGNSFVPRVIRAGMSDLDYTEVVSGLQEGEQVLLLSALAMQASRDSALARMRGRTGGGMPGVPTGGAGGGGRGRGQ